MSWWQKKVSRVFARPKKMFSKVASLLRGKAFIDDALLEQLRVALLEADVGLALTEKALTYLKDCPKDQKPVDRLRDFFVGLFPASKNEFGDPLTLLLIVGVNGVGKTTTIAKLAQHYQAEHRVAVASGDTYRAAADGQLRHWAEKSGADFIGQKNTKYPAAVMFDAVRYAKDNDISLLLADTAGRMHGNHNLMEQLKKVQRVCTKIDENIKPVVWLVLDGSLGQSSVEQAKLFHEALNVDGVIITKLDGAAKGGAVFSVAEQLSLPVCFVGLGESLNDLAPFDVNAFVSELLEA